MRLLTTATLTLASLLAASPALAQDGTFPPPDGGQRGPGGAPGQDGQRPGGMRGGDPAQMVERIMGQDQDGDGKLSRDEFPPMLVERLFERADTNKDGFVDRAELEVVAKDAGAMRGGRGGAGGQGGPGGAPQNLEGAMKQANRAYRILSNSALDASTMKADLDAVQQLQMGLVGSKAGIGSVRMSDAAKAKFGEDRAAFEKDFRKTMLKAIAVSFEIESALLDGNADAARAAIKKIHDSEETGHALFQQEGGEGGEAGGEAPARPRGGRGGRGQQQGGAPNGGGNANANN
jgi:hypothetical protein